MCNSKNNKVMRKSILSVIPILMATMSCSLEESTLDKNPITAPPSVTEQIIINEVVSLRNDLFGQSTKSISDIKITALNPLTKSSDVVPYVVNYPNNEGYAVVATDGMNVTTVAITSTGYLPPEILESALGAPAIFPIDSIPSVDDEYEPDDPDDALYGDEHLEPYPLDFMPFIEQEGGAGLVLSPTHPSIGLIVGSLGEVGWSDDNMITNPNMPGMPTIPPPIDSTAMVDSSLIGVWLNGYGVRPLIRTKWSQGEPYNQACPVMANGLPAIAGCTAICIGQITAFLAPPSLPYNWQTLSSFGHFGDEFGLNATEGDRSYVANYVRFVADGVRTDYGSNSSSSNRWRAKRFLKNVVGCEGVKIHGTRNMSKFIERINGRLKYHLPVYIRGDRYDETEGEKIGHAYIIDGYMQQRKYISQSSSITRTLHHINWGHGGAGDGYYKIDNFSEGNLATDSIVDDSTAVSKSYNLNMKSITYRVPSWR